MSDSGKPLVVPEVSAKTPHAKKQEQSNATHRELIDAARRIFARDGFDAARLEDIAAAAGKTRGAFYSHFQDKEDVFFAIFEDDIQRDTQAYLAQLRKSSTFEERVTVLVKHLESVIRDKARVLLYVEFKMYAIRQPHKRTRLAKLHAFICTHGSAADKLDLFPELQSNDPDEQRSRTAHFASLLDGLILNHYFDPVGLDKEALHHRLEMGIRLLMAPNSSWRKHSGVPA